MLSRRASAHHPGVQRPQHEHDASAVQEPGSTASCAHGDHTQDDRQGCGDRLWHSWIGRDPIDICAAVHTQVNLMKQYPYNPSKAAKMLDQAGFRVKNGERFGKAITLLYSPSTGAFTQEEA